MTHTETQAMCERLEEIQRRVDAATEGPWDSASSHLVRVLKGDLAVPIFRSEAPIDWHKNKRLTNAVMRRAYADEVTNAAFIAHAREDVPYLLALLTRQQEEIERLREAVKGSAVIVNVAKGELKHIRAVLRNQTCLLGSTMRVFSPNADEEYKGLTDFEIAVSPAIRAALQAKPETLPIL